MKTKDNTNNYNCSANIVYESGVSDHKKNIFNYLSNEEKQLFADNKIYMHDSEYFNITLNCVSMSLESIFKEKLIINDVSLDQPANISEIFTQLNIFIINLENEISGGLTFVNFDYELDKLLTKLEIHAINDQELKIHIKSLFQQINFANSRFGNQSPYISFTVGIVNTERASLICQLMLEVLEEGASGKKPYIFPNIHFRVKGGVNKNKQDPYYHLYSLSRKVTSHQMNPTYILADSLLNKDIDPLDLHVVGCRSRLLETLNGNKCGIGRTNIGAVSINLPNIAMRLQDEQQVNQEIKEIMRNVVHILITKQNILKDNHLKYAPTLIKNNLLYPFNNDVNLILDEASLSIGFIGGQEYCDILYPNKTLQDKHKLLNKTLKMMSDYCNNLSDEFKRIVTLIGVSGEGISYYFPQHDLNKEYSNNYYHILEKNFYTNSFHIPVYELINPIEKITIEGKNHQYCNGGCISYIEVSHVKDNIEGFEDLLAIAETNNIHYLGFNFEKNICNDCYLDSEDENQCTHCGSSHITKIRRVSGYLGYLNSFSKGKKLEETLRIRHTNIIN